MERTRITRSALYIASRLVQLRRRCLLVCLLGVCGNVWALEIEVVGLFKNAALVMIDGKQQLLKLGIQSPEGVELIQADSKGGIVEYNGDRIELSLSGKISTTFEKAINSTVRIVEHNNQFQTPGSINSRSVNFVIDTGATTVAMNRNHAAALGVDYQRGQVLSVETAGGVVGGHRIQVDAMTVGGISVSNVEVVVLEGGYPSDILLGMSFLKYVEIQKSEGVMTLTSKL